MARDRKDFSEEQEFQRYMDGLWPRMSEFGNRARNVPRGSYGSIEWTKQAGAFLWRAREASDIGRAGLARDMGVDVNEIRYAEFGVESPVFYEGEFPQRYLTTLKKPELYPTFRENLRMRELPKNPSGK